jgi:phage baseplate assembly protein W
MALIQRKDRTREVRTTPVLFSDFTSGFVKDPDSKDVIKVTNEDSVKSSIRNIVLTDRTQRFFNAQFGCDIRKMLFENIEPTTEAAIKKLITNAIENYEPRAELLDVVVSGIEDQNAYSIIIVFNTINNVVPEKLELILTRVR